MTQEFDIIDIDDSRNLIFRYYIMYLIVRLAKASSQELLLSILNQKSDQLIRQDYSPYRGAICYFAEKMMYAVRIKKVPNIFNCEGQIDLAKLKYFFAIGIVILNFVSVMIAFSNRALSM
ncbi:MAG: hypothetical protein LBJ93_03700 [Clostridiales bacterium]|jgi:hypothetical protein|nr:hypothetical protein [Clostridiales bacterium]